MDEDLTLGHEDVMVLLDLLHNAFNEARESGRELGSHMVAARGADGIAARLESSTGIARRVKAGLKWAFFDRIAREIPVFVPSTAAGSCMAYTVEVLIEVVHRAGEMEVLGHGRLQSGGAELEFPSEPSEVHRFIAGRVKLLLRDLRTLPPEAGVRVVSDVDVDMLGEGRRTGGE